jgi:hypothetical protein
MLVVKKRVSPAGYGLSRLYSAQINDWDPQLAIHRISFISTHSTKDGPDTSATIDEAVAMEDPHTTDVM